jgi:hypothetical protein
MDIPERYVRYADGRRLCRDFAERALGNFTRLLTEQVTSADLLDTTLMSKEGTPVNGPRGSSDV